MESRFALPCCSKWNRSNGQALRVRVVVVLLLVVVLQNKARGFTTPRSSRTSFPDRADFIAAEIEVRQRCAPPQHSCKALCPGIVDPIIAEIEASQRWALCQPSGKRPLCPGCSEVVIVAEIKVRQLWALHQHSCKALCILSFHVTARQLECADVASRLSSM